MTQDPADADCRTLYRRPGPSLRSNGRGSLARGSFADVTIFDPKKRWTFEAAKSRSLSQNTPFDGWQLTGKVVATIVGGKIVYHM